MHSGLALGAAPGNTLGRGVEKRPAPTSHASSPTTRPSPQIGVQLLVATLQFHPGNGPLQALHPSAPDQTVWLVSHFSSGAKKSSPH